MKKLIPFIFGIMLIAVGCATAPANQAPAPAGQTASSTGASAAATPAAPAPAAGALPATVPDSVAKLPFGDHVVLGQPIPPKPGVYAVLNGSDALVTWVTRIPAADIRLVGDFQNWKPELALPMFKTKNADGKNIWIITLKVAPDAVLLYKYYVNGQWTEDALAPGTQDDGFGGKNGKIDVKALLAAAPKAN